MPIVFCASLPPWPRLYRPAETSCRRRNRLSTRSGDACRKTFGDQHHQQRAEQEAEQRRDEDEEHRLPDAGGDQRAGAGLGDHRADDAADQRVRRARRDAVPPGDEVPGDRADQRAEDDVVVDDAGLDDALADRRRDAQVEDEDRDDVEEGGEDDRLLRLQHAGRDDGGDRVRGVVEAVHEVERDRQHDQQRDDAERDLGSAVIETRAALRNSRGRRPRSGWRRPRSGRRSTRAARRSPSA